MKEFYIHSKSFKSVKTFFSGICSAQKNSFIELSKNIETTNLNHSFEFLQDYDAKQMYTDF